MEAVNNRQCAVPFVLAACLAGCSDPPKATQKPIVAQPLEINARVERMGKSIAIVGQTNLPDNTQLIVTINRPHGRIVSQDDVVVRQGGFHSRSLNDHGKPYKPGSYNLSVSAAESSVQPPIVRAAIGPDYSNYISPLIDRSAIGTFVNFHEDIQVARKG